MTRIRSHGDRITLDFIGFRECECWDSHGQKGPRYYIWVFNLEHRARAMSAEPRTTDLELDPP